MAFAPRTQPLRAPAMPYSRRVLQLDDDDPRASSIVIQLTRNAREMRTSPASRHNKSNNPTPRSWSKTVGTNQARPGLNAAVATARTTKGLRPQPPLPRPPPLPLPPQPPCSPLSALPTRRLAEVPTSHERRKLVVASHLTRQLVEATLTAVAHRRRHTLTRHFSGWRLLWRDRQARTRWQGRLLSRCMRAWRRLPARFRAAVQRGYRARAGRFLQLWARWRRSASSCHRKMRAVAREVSVPVAGLSADASTSVTAAGRTYDDADSAAITAAITAVDAQAAADLAADVAAEGKAYTAQTSDDAAAEGNAYTAQTSDDAATTRPHRADAAAGSTDAAAGVGIAAKPAAAGVVAAANGSIAAATVDLSNVCLRRPADGCTLVACWGWWRLAARHFRVSRRRNAELLARRRHSEYLRLWKWRVAYAAALAYAKEHATWVATGAALARWASDAADRRALCTRVVHAARASQRRRVLAAWRVRVERLVDWQLLHAQGVAWDRRRGLLPMLPRWRNACANACSLREARDAAVAEAASFCRRRSLPAGWIAWCDGCVHRAESRAQWRARATAAATASHTSSLTRACRLWRAWVDKRTVRLTHSHECRAALLRARQLSMTRGWRRRAEILRVARRLLLAAMAGIDGYRCWHALRRWACQAHKLCEREGALVAAQWAINAQRGAAAALLTWRAMALLRHRRQSAHEHAAEWRQGRGLRLWRVRSVTRCECARLRSRAADAAKRAAISRALMAFACACALREQQRQLQRRGAAAHTAALLGNATFLWYVRSSDCGRCAVATLAASLHIARARIASALERWLARHSHAYSCLRRQAALLGARLRRRALRLMERWRVGAGQVARTADARLICEGRSLGRGLLRWHAHCRRAWQLETAAGRYWRRSCAAVRLQTAVIRTLRREALAGSRVTAAALEHERRALARIARSGWFDAHRVRARVLVAGRAASWVASCRVRTTCMQAWYCALQLRRRCRWGSWARARECISAHHAAWRQLCAVLRNARALERRRVERTSRQHLRALATYCAHRATLRRAAAALTRERAARERGSLFGLWRRQSAVRAALRALRRAWLESTALCCWAALRQHAHARRAERLNQADNERRLRHKLRVGGDELHGAAYRCLARWRLLLLGRLWSTWTAFSRAHARRRLVAYEVASRHCQRVLSRCMQGWREAMWHEQLLRRVRADLAAEQQVGRTPYSVRGSSCALGHAGVGSSMALTADASTSAGGAESIGACLGAEAACTPTRLLFLEEALHSAARPDYTPLRTPALDRARAALERASQT